MNKPDVGEERLASEWVQNVRGLLVRCLGECLI